MAISAPMNTTRISNLMAPVIIVTHVVGFAADGFPIFGSYINDNGTIRPDGPAGQYSGTFIDDWEFVAGFGDLDACNGMVQDGVDG